MNPYTQGIYTPRNPTKYKGTLPPTYRSRPELRLMRFFDDNSKIVEWTSESIIIPYIKPIDGKIHRYYVDFSCVLKESNGTLVRYLIEYKPYKQTIMPSKGKKSERTFLMEQLNYSTNMSKWKSAREYTHSHNMKFLILTENDLPD
jgi:hypothetical protein